jgi:anaphase-promoting complex subunit 5
VKILFLVTFLIRSSSFLEAWRAGDYPTSFDNLHRFFDYTMQNRDRSFYQYALLNLAVLEADFGSYQEAVTAMQETVSVARENKDMGCLNFSLSWLYHFGKAHPKVINEADKTNMLGVEREGLVFLRTKAKESGMWNLWSAALLTEAKAGLANGESIATAFENILRSSELSVTKNMMNNVGAQMMLQSSLWSRLGVTSLASSYCEVFLRCHSKTAPFDDILKFTCRAAYLLAEKGRYGEAMNRLEGLDADSLRQLKANQYWLTFRGILRLKRDLNENNLDGADQLLGQLLQCRGGDSDLTFELNRLQIDAMMRGGDYQGALTKIESLAAEQKEDGEDIYFRVKLLIMKAVLFDKCGRPQKGFSIAVRAAAIAWRARLLSALWQAMGAIANILTSLEEFEASSQILASIMPRALECEDCALNAQLYSFFVDAHMGMAGLAERESLKRTENLTKALDFIDRAFTEYSSIEDIKGQCEMMAKKATIMRLVGDMVLANDYAAAYLALKREASQPVA